jgi:prevent-host-death family protein
MTQIVSAKQFRENFSEILNEAVYGEKRILITRNGKSQAILVGVKGYNPADFMTKKEWKENFKTFTKISSRGKSLSENKAMKVALDAVAWARKQKTGD